VSQSRIFVVPIESNDDIYDGLPIYEKIQLLFMDYLYEIQINELDKLLSEIKFEWVPGVDFGDYPSTLRNVSLDFGLCPLKDTPFNRCRSASKAMEYNLAGALAFSSNIVTYQNDPTSILVNDTDWEEQLEFYITHPEIKEKVQSEHLSWIRNNRNIMDKVDLLKSIYVV
jgi:hypothetical protein